MAHADGKSIAYAEITRGSQPVSSSLVMVNVSGTNNAMDVSVTVSGLDAMCSKGGWKLQPTADEADSVGVAVAEHVEVLSDGEADDGNGVDV